MALRQTIQTSTAKNGGLTPKLANTSNLRGQRNELLPAALKALIDEEASLLAQTTVGTSYSPNNINDACCNSTFVADWALQAGDYSM